MLICDCTQFWKPHLRIRETNLVWLSSWMWWYSDITEMSCCPTWLMRTLFFGILLFCAFGLSLSFYTIREQHARETIFLPCDLYCSGHLAAAVFFFLSFLCVSTNRAVENRRPPCVLSFPAPPPPPPPLSLWPIEHLFSIPSNIQLVKIEKGKQNPIKYKNSEQKEPFIFPHSLNHDDESFVLTQGVLIYLSRLSFLSVAISHDLHT